MSKRTRKVTLELEPDEAAVVAPLGFWDRLEQNFLDNAENPLQPEDEETWRIAANHVREWRDFTRA